LVGGLVGFVQCDDLRDRLAGDFVGVAVAGFELDVPIDGLGFEILHLDGGLGFELGGEFLGLGGELLAEGGGFDFAFGAEIGGGTAGDGGANLADLLAQCGDFAPDLGQGVLQDGADGGEARSTDGFGLIEAIDELGFPGGVHDGGALRLDGVLGVICCAVDGSILPQAPDRGRVPMTAIWSGVYHRADRDGIPPAVGARNLMGAELYMDNKKCTGEFSLCIYGFYGVRQSGAA
jgi:hypothetical protein